MYLCFAERCYVELINESASFVNYLKNEGLIGHRVFLNEGGINEGISVWFAESSSLFSGDCCILHPGSSYNSSNFRFHDKRGKFAVVDYGESNSYKIIVEFDFDSAFLWEILFDHVKVFLLKRGVVTVHAASFSRDSLVYILFGWDGAGKSSILLQEISKGASYVGDDRVFISQFGVVYPLYRNIKQFSHELVSYPSYLNRMSFCRRLIFRFFIGLEGRRKGGSCVSSFLLFLFRRFSVNVDVTKVESLEKRRKASKGNVFYNVSKIGGASASSIPSNENIAANIVADDFKMIRRYYEYRYFPGSRRNDCLDNYFQRLSEVIGLFYSKDDCHNLIINNETRIEDIELV